MSEDLIQFSGMEAEISSLISDLERSIKDVDAAVPAAALSAAEVIRNEQVRLLAKAHFKRDKKNHVYKMVSGSLITIQQDKASKRFFKLRIGYDTPTLRENPELLVIEFGRPGKSKGRMKPTDTLGRKKGSFPSAPHIRTGFFLAKEKAADKFNETLYKIAADDFKG